MMMLPWFSPEVAAMRRFLKLMPLLVVGLLATGCTAAEDMTGPGAPSAALAGVRVTSAESAPVYRPSKQEITKESLRRGTRYAMGAN
jgi:hypothetical protein